MRGLRSLRYLLILALLASLAGAQVIGDTLTLSSEPPGPPSSVTGGFVGTNGGADLFYRVAARYPNGYSVPANPLRVSRTPGVAGLNGANYVQLQWAATPNVVGYYVIRTTTRAFTGACVSCVVVANTAATGFSDIGGATTNWPPAGYTTTGGATFNMILDNRSAALPYIRILLNGVTWLPMFASATGDMAVTGDLSVAGDTTLAGTLGVTGDLTLGEQLIGRSGTVLDNETLFKWQTDAEVYVGDPAAAFTDWSTRADVTQQGFRSRVSHDLVNGTTTTLYGGLFEVQALAPAAGGFFSGIRAIATTEAGITGTDIFDGVYGESNPSNGLLVSGYGVFGIMNIDGTTAAGADMLSAGVKGDWDDAVGLSTEYSTWTAGVLGYVSDNDTVGPDAAVVAMLGGGGTRTTDVNAGFRVIDQAANADFDYGIDLFYNDGGPLPDNAFTIADLRGQSGALVNNRAAEVWEFEGASGDYADVEVGNAVLEDKSVLGTESLANIADFSQATWALAGEFAVDGTFATYTWAATGLGTVTQAAVNQAIVAIGSQRYRLQYTISAAPTVVDATMTLTVAYGLTAVPLPIIAGLNTVYFDSAVAPVDFVIDIAGATAGAFTIESVTLKQIQGGGTTSRGPNRLAGMTLGDLGTPVNGSMIYCVDCDPSVAGAMSVCVSAGAKTGAMAFRIAGGWGCISQ